MVEKGALALGGLGQVSLIVFAIMAILQYPTAAIALTSLVLISEEGIRTVQMQSLVASEVLLVFAILTMFSMIELNRENDRKKITIVGALLGLATAATAMGYSLLQLSDISIAIFGLQGISLYGTTVFAAFSPGIAGPVLVVTVLSTAKLLSSNESHVPDARMERLAARAYKIAGAFEATAIPPYVISWILYFAWHPVIIYLGLSGPLILGLNLALAGFVAVVIGGAAGTISFFHRTMTG